MRLFLVREAESRGRRSAGTTTEGEGWEEKEEGGGLGDGYDDSGVIGE